MFLIISRGRARPQEESCPKRQQFSLNLFPRYSGKRRFFRCSSDDTPEDVADSVKHAFALHSVFSML